MDSAALLIRHRARSTPEARRAEIMADVEPFLGMTPEECDAVLQQVVRAAHQALLDSPRVLTPEPPAPDFQALWQRLRARVA